MPRTVRFLTECAGRNKGVVETVYDDTLAAAWVDARLAEYVDGPAPAAPSVTVAPVAPPVDRMARPARRSKGK